MTRIIIFLLLCIPATLAAQTPQADLPARATTAPAAADSLKPDMQPAVPADASALGEAETEPVPLAGAVGLPWNMPDTSLSGYGLGGYGLDGPGYWGYTPWRLHEGFNAQLGMSVSAAFGKHAPRGVGFGQTAAFAYVQPITPKLSLAAGIYAHNMDWGVWHRTDVGIAGTLAYQVNDRINLYAYGAESFLPRTDGTRMRRDPFPLYLERQRDRIGAAAEFKIGNNAMIGISIERSTYDY